VCRCFLLFQHSVHRRFHSVHASRDQVLLDGNVAQADDGDEDEVFGLKGVEDTDEGEEVDDEDEDLGDVVDEADALRAAKKDRKPPKAKSKPKSKKRPLDEFYSEEGSESESQEEIWGRTKAAYFTSKDDQLDSENEEANEQHEQEARRLQAKSRDGMVEADFGLEDAIDLAEDTA
jgi:U3 small nucleolar RNA-associated protein 3